jgi:CelD/BcsL family acetyltransferase involved in cellulose biosynthesis
MKIEVVPARGLPSELVARWDEIVRSHEELASPFLRPELTLAVAAVRGNVEVGVIRDGNSIVGFLPFERVQRYVARPVGNRLSDCQAVIASPELPWVVSDLMKGCRLRAWEFDHQLASQRQLADHSTKTGNSWRLNVARGFDWYIADRKANGGGMLTTLLRKFRKLQREHDVRFEWQCDDESVFDELIAWKSDQYRRSQYTDLFAYPWVVEMLKNLWRSNTTQFTGLLNVVYANDKPAAIHFGIRSGSLLHYWFPAYDVAMGKYSCGAALLLFLIQQAGEQGIRLIDLGKGDDDYKLTFANDALPLAEGIIETRRTAAAFRNAWQQTRAWVHRSPVYNYARTPIRWLRQMREWAALR